MSSLLTSFQSHVTLDDKPFEQTIEETLSNGADRVVGLLNISPLGHKLVSDLNPRLQQVFV